MLPKRNSIKVLLISSILISGCSLEIPNIEICRDDIESGFCAFTLGGEERTLEGNEWDIYRQHRLSMSAVGFGKFKKFILQACSMDNVDCKKEELEEKLATFELMFKVVPNPPQECRPGGPNDIPEDDCAQHQYH